MLTSNQLQKTASVVYPSEKTNELATIDQKVRRGEIYNPLLKRPRAIIYCRVSTEKQEEEGESLEYQKEKCLQYAELRGYEVIAVLEEVQSGYIHFSLRQKLSLARQMLRDKIADVLIVFDLRRFSRNFVHSALIFEEVEQAGGIIESVEEKIDNSLTGKLIRSILSWCAESERQKIVEYANRRWQTRLEQNLPIGTGKKPYGWDWEDEEKTKYVLNLDEAGIRFSLYYMFVDLDMSLRQIAKQLKSYGVPTPSAGRGEKKQARAWHPSTIRNMLLDKRCRGILPICTTTRVLGSNGKYTQRPNPHKKEIPNALPAIVDAERYERAIRKLQTNRSTKSHPPKEPEAYLLRAGYAYCAICKKRINARTNKAGRHYYQCTEHSKTYGSCTNRGRTPAAYVDNIVWSECCALFELFDIIQAKLETEIERVVHELLVDTTAIDHIKLLEEEIRFAKEERSRHQEGSYYYTLVSKDIADKQKTLQKYIEEQKKTQPVIGETNLYKKKLLWLVNFLNSMRGEYQNASYKQKRNAIDILGVKAYMEKDIVSKEVKLNIKYSPLFAPDHRCTDHG